MIRGSIEVLLSTLYRCPGRDRTSRRQQYIVSTGGLQKFVSLKMRHSMLLMVLFLVGTFTGQVRHFYLLCDLNLFERNFSFLSFFFIGQCPICGVGN